MGFIKAFAGAIGGTFADQWIDFFTVPNVQPTAALFPAVKQETNAGRGSNTKGSDNIITNGSKIVIPEGYGLITLQDGEITGLVAEAGGYAWQSDDVNSQSIFAGNGFLSPLILQSWERFKRGGIPGSQQAAYYVSLKELPNNRFGTQSEIYWDDAWLGTQVGALTRGTYTLRIVDPILFVKNFVPATYFTGGTGVRLHRPQQRRGHAAVQRGHLGARPRVLEVHERPGEGPHHADPVRLARVRAEPGRRRRGGLRLEGEPRPRDRLDRDHLHRVRRRHHRAAVEGQACRRPVGRTRQLEPAGLGRAGLRERRRDQRRRRARRPRHGGRHRRSRRAAAAGRTRRTRAHCRQRPPQHPAADDPIAKLTQAKQMLDAGLITQDDYDALKNKVLGS